MGTKLSRQTSKESNNIFSANSDAPYEFLDTSEVQSSRMPKIMKIFTRSQVGGGDGSSLVFLRDEKCLLFGAAYCPAFLHMTFRFLEEPHRNILHRGRLSSSSDRLFLLDDGEMYQVSDNSVRDISVSSNKEFIAVLEFRGFSALQLWQCNMSRSMGSTYQKFLLQDEVEHRNSTSHATACSISPNGKWIVLAVCSNYFTIGDENHLEIYTINSKNKLEKKQTCNPNLRHEMIIINLSFSPDSKFIAAGSFEEHNSRVFMISTKTWDVALNFGENTEHLSPLWGVFNPLSSDYQVLSLTKGGLLREWNARPLYESLTPQICLTNNMNVTECYVVDKPEVTSCPEFSCDGSLFGVTLSNGDIVILDPNQFAILWTIPCDFGIFSATSVSFSKSCEYVAVGYSGDVVGIWLLPRLHFTLKHYCRTKVNSVCPPKLIDTLPIPKCLKQYLLYEV